MTESWTGPAEAALPEDAAHALLAGRGWRPDVDGPVVVACRDGQIHDLSGTFATMRDLTEAPDPAAALRAADGPVLGTLADLWVNTNPDTRDPAAVPDRPPGGQGRRGDLSGLDAGAGDRGAGRR